MSTGTTRQRLIDIVVRQLNPQPGSPYILEDNLSNKIETIIESLESPERGWITKEADRIYRSRLKRVRFLADIRIEWLRRH